MNVDDLLRFHVPQWKMSRLLKCRPNAKFIGFRSNGLRYKAIQIRRSFRPPVFGPPPLIELLAARALHRLRGDALCQENICRKGG
jgi:hypothetical protein